MADPGVSGSDGRCSDDRCSDDSGSDDSGSDGDNESYDRCELCAVGWITQADPLCEGCWDNWPTTPTGKYWLMRSLLTECRHSGPDPFRPISICIAGRFETEKVANMYGDGLYDRYYEAGTWVLVAQEDDDEWLDKMRYVTYHHDSMMPYGIEESDSGSDAGSGSGSDAGPVSLHECYRSGEKYSVYFKCIHFTYRSLLEKDASSGYVCACGQLYTDEDIEENDNRCDCGKTPIVILTDY